MPSSELTVSFVNISGSIASRNNHKDISRISYSYDWLQDVPAAYLTKCPPEVSGYRRLSSPPQSTGSPTDSESSETVDVNGFSVYPRQAGLSWPTGLHQARQSRHWPAGLKISSELLELFSSDADSNKAVRPNGKSLAKIAQHELLLPEEDRFTKFATYLFPEADEERTRLLAATIVFIVIFDDSWEMHETDKLGVVRDDFIRRLESDEDGEDHKTELQTLIDYVVRGLKAHDKVAGNAGQEVIKHLVAFCRHVPPRSEFTSLADYLTYRNIDAGVPYILACVKFSLASDVWIEDPKLATILRLISDHVSLVNDLASFDKELRAFEEGKVCYLINAVDVVRKLFGLSNWQSAKALTFAMQLEVESLMEEELTRLSVDGYLTQKEEEFVQACLTMTAGNVFYSIVTSSVFIGDLNMHFLLLFGGGLILFLAVVALRRRYTRYLRDVPAISVLATVSRWEYVRQILSARMERNLLEAHRRLGPLVRIAHNEVSIADPAAIPIIYDTEQRWVKADWYSMFGFPDPSDVNPFSATDPVEHKRMKRNVGPTYSMSALMDMEPSVDSTLTIFLQRLEEAAISPKTPVSERGSPIDLVQWLAWLAADIIGEMSFSRRLGFLDTMSDVGDFFKIVDSFISYASSVAVVPFMHKFLFGNPIIPYLVKAPSLVITDVTKDEVQKRREKPDQTRSDIMGRIIKSQKTAGPERFPPSEILNMAAVNLTAGTDTSATGLHSLIYYLLKNPAAMKKLQAEITEAERSGSLSNIPQYRETNHMAMPYLAACIKETFRIHPAVTISLPRHVPAGGAHICGQFFPAGTRVGISPYVVGRDRKLFGEDADKFRPERWIDCSREQLMAMENGCLHFGHGSRVCLGRHIAMLEITKVIVAILRGFHLELASPNEEWEIRTYNVPKPKSINVWIYRRERNDSQSG